MPTAHSLAQQAIALHRTGSLDEAARLYEQALASDPRQFEARHMLGVVRLQQGDVDSAIALIVDALALQPDSADAHCDAAFALQLRDRLDESRGHYARAIALRPRDVNALFGRADVLCRMGRFDEALADFDQIVALEPTAAEAFNLRGRAAMALNRLDRAVPDFEQALRIKPDFTEALNNLGTAFAYQHRFEDAIACFDGVLQQNPDAADALNNRGNALAACGRHGDAVTSYDRAIASGPGNAALYFNRGISRLALNLNEAAIEDFDRALTLDPTHAEALQARGHAASGLRRYEEASRSYLAAYDLKPSLRYVLGDAAHASAHLCDWARHDELARRVVEGVRAGQPACVPFVLLGMTDEPAVQLACAAQYARDNYPVVATPLWQGPRHRDGRIRLAYLSAKFHEHAGTQLIAELFETHDRNRFEVCGISFGPDSSGPLRARIQAGLDRFLDVRGKSDAEVAALMRSLEIDIAVDLVGYQALMRPGILAHRPAPIQVNFPGFPGSTGADFIDYIIADPFVIPDGADDFYTERVVRLPDCFQVNDSDRSISDRIPKRSELGLPEQGFVFCSFNTGFKITPSVFDVWMRLLQRVDGSVLWLLKGEAALQRNLCREAESRSIDPSRLVFAPKIGLAEHLARHRAADLFLDTLPCNAHVTASDALWAGLPVLTCAGKTFASRVAGSLLRTMGLPELITDSFADYEARAIDLARDPTRLRALRDKLARARTTSPLFQTDRYRRHLEAAFATMWQTHRRGMKPDSFSVAPP